MKRKRVPTWRYTAGKKGHTVTVYERWPGGPLQARCFDPTLCNGRGGYRCLSLGHRDRDKAEAYALTEAAKLREGRPEMVVGTLGRLFAAYTTHRSAHKSEGDRREDARRVTLWTKVLGARKDPHLISRGEWEGFIRRRRTGEIDGLGEAVKAGERRTVRDGTVRADCRWLSHVLRWGTTWREHNGNGPYLLRENPVRGYAVPEEKNPRRPLATQDRYEAIQKVSDQVTMEVRGNGKRHTARSYLSELLDLVHGTGRRINAVLRLRYGDLDLAKTKAAPHGAILWPSETDKKGKEWRAPITAAVRAALDRIVRERPGIGAAYLFPSPTTPGEPVRYELTREWLMEAERLADVPKHDGSTWHAYRRGWATARKGLPDVDVAAAGGWKSTDTLRRCYQQPDDATILAVVLGGAEVREAQG